METKMAICRYKNNKFCTEYSYTIIYSDDNWESAYNDSGTYYWTHGCSQCFKYKEITTEQLDQLFGSDLTAKVKLYCTHCKQPYHISKWVFLGNCNDEKSHSMWACPNCLLVRVKPITKMDSI